MSEIRENLLTGEWVIIAPERAKRQESRPPAPRREAPPSYLATCPFCPGNEASSEERFRLEDGNGRWILRSVVNKYSVLSPVGEAVGSDCAIPGAVSVNGVGLHEVLVETPCHDGLLALSPAVHVRRVLETFRHRFLEFYADPRVRHVIVFKNQGLEAGASQQHPHSQIVGIPIVPGQVVDRIERARRFYSDSGQCSACTLIARELALGCRIVAENEFFVAFIPHAALSPYHLWIFPKTHTACFSGQPLGTFPALSEILQTVLAKVHGMLDNPPFNLVIRSLDPRGNDEPYFHWYISIVPRVNKVAGFELGTGMYVNPSSPESCARALREFSPSAGCKEYSSTQNSLPDDPRVFQ